jgi:hypothetical protein
LKRRGFTAEGRERLRQSALVNRPWLHSTGPRTAAGKLRVAENGRPRQAGELSAREVRRQLAALGNLATDMAALRLALRPQRPAKG